MTDICTVVPQDRQQHNRNTIHFMEMHYFFYALALLLPGALACIVYQVVTRRERLTLLQFAARTLLYGLCSHAILCLLAGTIVYDNLFAFWEGYPSLPYDQFIGCLLTATGLALLLAIARHHHLLLRLARVWPIDRTRRAGRGMFRRH